MPSIAEIKKQYPDLDGLDDDQVVDAIHEAFYRDVPREDVAKSLGVKPAPAAVEPRSMLRVAGDVGISALKGAIAVPEAAVGLADMATGGRAGKLAEDIGFRPKDAKLILDAGYSDQQKEAFRQVQAADGLGDTFMAAVRNPSVVAHSVVESLPSMGAGGVLARGGLALAPKLGAVAAASLGEGVVGAGSAAEQIRQETPDGLLTGQQAGLAGVTGAVTTGFGMLGGKIAKKLGIADVDTMLTGAATYPAMRKGVVRSALEGAIAEGVLEELPQSISEQVLQNMALGKPLEEGVNQAAVLGLLSGAAMGGGANALSSMNRTEPGVTAGVSPTFVPVQPAGPLARAAAAVAPGTAEGIAAANQPPAPDPVDDPVAETIGALPDGVREKALRAYAVINNPDVAKGVRSYNQKLLDGLLEQVASEVQGAQEKQGAALAGKAQAATEKIAPVTESVNQDTGEITTAFEAREADRPKQLPDDILNAQNKPFTNMGAAKKTAQALGDGFAPFKLGTNAFVVRAKPADQAPSVAGDAIDKDWTAFTPESGTKGVPRADMPQIKAEHRGAMVNFLNARGITHESVDLPAADLKPTQAEFSQAKVDGAKAFEGGDRSILVSSDGHILDGHHQWLAKRDAGEPVKAIRLNSPIADLLATVKEFPSAETAEGGTAPAQIDTAAAPANAQAQDNAGTGSAAGPDVQHADKSDAALKPIKAPYITKEQGDHLFGVVQRKQIPDMTDDELVKMQAFYHPDHKRTPKIAKEIARRAQAAINSGAKDESATQESKAAQKAGAVGAPGGADVLDVQGADGARLADAGGVAPGVQAGKAPAGLAGDVRVAAEKKPLAQDTRAQAAIKNVAEKVPTQKTAQIIPKIIPGANTVFTEDAAAAARSVLKAKLSGTLNSGIDPELLQAGLTLAGYHIEKGARTFAAYAKAMLADLGDGVKPYLKSWYMAVKYDPRAAAFEGMDTPAAMESVDLDKLTGDADTGGGTNGHATRQLDQSSTGALEGAPAEDVRAPGEGGDAGNSPDRSGASDIGGDARPDDAGGQPAGGLGASAGAVPVPARGTKPGAQDAQKPRVPRARRSDAGPGLFGDAGGLTPDDGANPAPNAPAIAAPQITAEDFTITDDLGLGEGGQKTKFKDNVAAIRLLAELEKADRLATPDEQKVLAKYVGWGGLPQAFDAANADWAREHAEITALMTPEELASARQSTRYAHYTSKEVIQDGIYAAMRRFGFTGGKTLEAGAGVGNFLGLMPADMRSAGRFTAIEREPFSSAIARQLYPQQSVQRADFAEFRGTDAYFDAAVGNPPFASDAQTDRSGRKHLSGLSLHNYFFAKSVDMLREGGIMAQVITNAFLDAKGDAARKYIGDRVKFLGAIRLPNSAFSKNANTDVTTDIVFLQKRPDGEFGGKAAREDAKRWQAIGSYRDARGKTVALNQYFIDHPDMMLGDFGAYGSMYGPDHPALKAKAGQDTLALLKEAIGKLPEGIYRSIAETGTAEHTKAAITALKNPTVREGGYFMEGEKLMQRMPDLAGEARGVQITPETQWTEKTKLGDIGFDRIKALSGMRSTVRGLIAAEMADDGKAMKALRATLNEQYDAYRDTHGLINDPSTLRVFEDDPDFPLLASLEHGYTPGIGLAAAKRMGVKSTKSTARKGPIFSQRVVAARQQVQKVDTPADALAVSMAERGKLDAGYIGELLGKEPEAVLKELSTGDKPLLFRDPATDEYVLRDAYLSGNVRAKLAQANAAGMFANVAALEAVQPPEVASHEIVARIGSPWVPTAVYEDFAKELFGDDSNAVVTYLKANSSYQLYVTAGNSVKLTNTWGTPAYPGDKMLGALLNNRSIKVTYLDEKKTTRTDVEATETANTKAQEVKDRFSDWLFSDPDRSELLTKAYNETNNNYVTRQYDGANMTYPGKVPDSIIKFRRHQRDAIARIVQDRTALLDHVVGSGKTFTVVAGAMELKRTGLARKPMVAVPNHLVKQWAADFYRLYPGANVLTATKKDFEKANRRKFLARIATGDWDAVVIAHSSFGFIKPAPEFEAEFNAREIKKIMATIDSVEASDGEKQTKRRTVKQLEAMKERLENRVRALRDKPMDDLLDFEQIGVDQLFVDEAHLFKNLMFSTKMQQVQGLGDSAGSQRAYDMYVKGNQVMEKNGRGQGLVFATGTPVSNSLAEMYHMMRYLMPTQMRELGFESFDAWANTFASVEQVWMQAPSGDGFKASNRMSNFVNTTELLKMFDQVSDTVTMDDIKKAYSEENGGAEFPLPKLKGGRRTPVSLDKSPAQDAYMAEIATRAKLIEARRGPPKKGDDNILVVMGDARKAAMDIRLVDVNVTEREKGGRIDVSATETFARYQKYDQWKGTQIVFSDLGTPLKHAKAELKEYEALQERIQAGTDDVAGAAALGDEGAIATLEDVEAAQAELDGKGADWLGAVQAALRGFSVYDDFKAALMEKGVPEAEIAFIHDYNTDDQKATAFRKMNAGQIRVLLGSTQKLGAGTNVQERLVAEHHLDVPWRPSDVEQREGRIERQGNVLMTEIPGFEIEILAYVTKDTLDMRMWQVQETKLKMINQLRSRQISREIDNAFEDMELSAGEMQAAATGDINLLKEIQIRNDVKKLEQKRRSFEAQRNDLISRRRRVQDNMKALPAKLAAAKKEAGQAQAYFADLQNNPPEFKMVIDGTTYTDAGEAQAYLREKVDAREESTDLAGEKTSRAAPVAIEINGELFKSRAAIGDAYAEARGDIEPILWTFNKTDYRRRAKLGTALRQNIVDSIADETLKPLGTIAGYEVAVEGQLAKDGITVIDLTMSRDGKVAMSKEITTNEPAKAPDRVIRVVENLLDSSVQEVDWLERSLSRAKKEAAELETVADAGTWPEEAKLEAARAAHKEVLGKLKKKDGGAAAAPGSDEVMFSRSKAGALKPIQTPAGTAFQGDAVVLGKPRLNVKQPGGDVTRIDFELRDPVEFAKARAEGVEPGPARERANVGILTMDLDKAGQFKSLRNIEIFESKRGTGMAEKVVGAIMASLPETAKLHIHDILPTAVGFWDKMGAKFPRSEDFMEAFLTPQQFRKAYDTRTSAAGKKGSPGEQGEALFSRGRGGRPGNDGESSAQEAGASETVEAKRATAEVERIVAGITSRWANAPEVVVVYDMQDPRIPAKAREADQKLRSGGTETNPDAFFHRNKVYLIASNIGTPQKAAEMVLHESLGHFGLRGSFGEQLKPLLAQLAALRRTDVEAKAKEYGLDINDEAQRLQAAEEVLAEMAQTRPEIGFVKRAIAIIRSWLRRNIPGFKNLALTDAEIISSYILPARGWVESGARADGVDTTSNLAPAFSRSLPEALSGAMNSAQDVKLPAGYLVNDFFKADGKLSWWHKSVGTQYNLAQRSAPFKKVFDGVQDFINDVSFYASEAADLAPSILPKMESWKDITKSPISAADNKAIAAPIFEGTLTWMRDGAGKPVAASVMEAAAAKMSVDDKAQRLFREDKISQGALKMWQGLPIEQYETLVNGKYDREFLKPGIVFTPAELKNLFKLTDAQVALYGEFRAAVDKSLTNMAVADMVRFGGEDVAAVRDVALAMGDVDAAAALLRDHLMEQSEGSERAGVLLDTADTMILKADRARDLMDRGYAPLSRFGSYSLDVVDENGERVYFGLFESKAEANRMARQMKGNFPAATIQQGTMSDEEYKLFAGVSPETLELFGEMLGLESGADDAGNQVFQQYLKLAKANRSAMKRLIQRKGIAGFSEDPGRVLAGFVYSNARQTSSGLHMGNIAESVKDIPKGQGELKDAAVRLMDYVKNPQEEAQAIRGLMFAQYLGGSIASAMVNLMQPLNVTFPWLSQHGGVMKAAGQMKNAVVDALKKTTGDKTLDAALKKAEEDGIVAPQEVFQLMAQAQGKATLKPGDGTTVGNAAARASNAWSKTTLAWGKVFGLAEQFNRRTTFIAAYRTAVEQGMADPAKFAERAVQETQFVYNKGAKPKWARGAVGGVLFTFKSYSINYVELLSRMASSGPEGRKAALLALAVLFMMSGAGGLPFAEDIEDVVDGAMQRLGYNFNSKQAKQEFFTGLLGRPGAEFVERGISGLAGVPIDVSGRLGMGNLLPGTGLLTKKQDHTRDMLEIAGPAGDLAKRAFEAAGKLVDGNILGRSGAVATMSPTAARNLIQANDMAMTGMYRDSKGKKVIDVDGYDVLAKAIGFQPNDVARVQEATGQVQNMIGQNKLREAEIADQWAQGLFENDTAKVQRAKEALKRWNESNPAAPIRIQIPQVIKRVKSMREDKATRIAKTTPKEIRATVRRELSEQ